jgi:hypothetical protein
VDLGQPVTDTATLTGTANQPGSGGPASGMDGSINPTTSGAPAGGTITFTLLKDDCSVLARGTGTNPEMLPVSGDGSYGPVELHFRMPPATTTGSLATTATRRTRSAPITTSIAPIATRT